MAEKRHREDGLEERREDLALALPDISGCSVSASSHLEMALVVAGTPEGPEIKRRRSKKNVNRVQPTLGLKILLPNKTSVRLSIVREPPLSLRQLLRRLSEQAKGGKYSVDCDEDLLLKDPVNGSAPEIRTDEDLASLFRCPEAERTLLLVDGNPNPEYGDKEMWNITPEPAIMTRLPQGYTSETALADLIDNALQAVWHNPEGTRYISVDVERNKITIFDNGPAMTADDGPNSIAKWGTLGSSTHRDVHHEGMGGKQLKPPFVKPCLGKYGAGGVSAAFHIGSHAEVFSKTKSATMVCSLNLSPYALDQQLKKNPVERYWKVSGALRPVSNPERDKAPQGSFTKVEITNLRKHYSCTKNGDRKPDESVWKEKRVKWKLKDIYAPYIQCDDMETSRTIRPVIFKVNGEDLAEVEGGEVTISNKYSCPAEEFVVDLHWKMEPDTYSDQQATGVKPKDEAHARLCCQYFPKTKGKEALQSVLDELGHVWPVESFQTMMRVSVRWLGRLLPETKWPLLPFMKVSPRHNKDGIRSQWANRVKACLFTDGGFYPNQAKTGLDKDHPFTVAAQNLGATEEERSKMSISGLEVHIYRSIRGKSVTPEKLVKEYMAWLKARHETFDEEVTVGANDNPVFVTRHKGLDDWCAVNDCSAGVFEFHKHMQDANNDWDATKTPPLRIKMQKGQCGLKKDLYATVEFFFHSGGFEERGEVGVICRPMDVSEAAGSRINVNDMLFVLGESKVFSISVLMSEKTARISEAQWQKKEEENKNRAPSYITALGIQDCRRLGIDVDEAFPEDKRVVDAGFNLPTQLLAVVRTKRGLGTSKQASICTESMELRLTVTYSTFRDGEKRPLLYVTSKAGTVAGSKGVYVFNMREAGFGPTLEKEGTYVFTFSLVSERFTEVPEKNYDLTVNAAEQTDAWKISVDSSNCGRAQPTFRLDEIGSSLFLLHKLDRFENIQRFKNNKEVEDLDIGVRILAPGGHNLGVQAVRKTVVLSRDKRCVHIQDLLLSGGDLNPIQPQSEALLRFYLKDLQLDDVRIQVLPGRLMRMVLKHSEPDISNSCFRPDDVIQKLTIQGLDGVGNKADGSQRVVVKLDGLNFSSGEGQERLFNLQNDGTLDLGGNLKITAAFCSSGSVNILAEDHTQLITLQLRVAFRRLQLCSEVPRTSYLGESLTNVVIEVIDERGSVDTALDGGLHNLLANFNKHSVYSLRSGRCSLPPVALPSVVGLWRAEIKHAAYPSLKLEIEVEVKLGIAVRLAPKSGHNDKITTECGDLCSLEFGPVTETGQQGRLPEAVIERLELDCEPMKLEQFQSSPGQWAIEDFCIHSLYEKGSTGYAASFKMTGPAGDYKLTLRDREGSWENAVCWTVRLKPGRPRKLSAFLLKPGFEAYNAELEPLSRLRVPRQKALQSFLAVFFDASGNVCDTHEICSLGLEAEKCPNWVPHFENVINGQAIFNYNHVDLDVGSYVFCIRPSNPSIGLEAASFMVDVTPGNYPSAIRLTDATPLNVTHNQNDILYLPGMTVVVEAADGQELQQRGTIDLTITKSQGTEVIHHTREVGAQCSSQVTFARVPAPFQAGEYELMFCIANVAPVKSSLFVHHGPPAEIQALGERDRLLITILDKHNNLCQRVSGVEIRAQLVGKLQELVAVVKTGCATFFNLPFEIYEPKLQLRVFIHNQGSCEISCPELMITVVRNLPRAIRERSEKIQRTKQQQREAQCAIDARVEELRLINEDIASTEGHIQTIQVDYDRLKVYYPSDYELLEREKKEPERKDADIVADLRKNMARGPSYKAALALVEARYPYNFLHPQSGGPIAAEVLGPVVTLGRVESKALNSILSEYLGSSMLHLVCKTRRAVKALEYHNNGQVDRERGLIGFARRQKYDIDGRYSAVPIETMTPFTRNDNRNTVLRDHPQQLLNMDPPQLPNNEGCPRGFLGYAVNLIHLRDEHLQIRVAIRGQEVGLRESLFFDLYKRLMVFDTRANVELFQDVVFSRGWRPVNAVSVDGGIWRANGRQELGERSDRGRDNGLLYVTVPYLERESCSLLSPACEAFTRMRQRQDLWDRYNEQSKNLAQKHVDRQGAEKFVGDLREALEKVADEEGKARRLVTQWEQAMESITQKQRKCGTLPAMDRDIFVLPS